MDMNFEQLRGFVEIARVGGFTRAAEELHLSQPSLSRQISTLERELGSDLFHRARGNISLTAAGELLLPYARRMLADAATARREMDEVAGLRRGRVRLGAPPSLCASVVPDVLSAFRHEHPGIEVEMMERGSRALVAALAEGGLDLALLASSDVAADATVSLVRTPLLAEDLVVISAAAAPEICAGTAISLHAVADLALIAFPRSYALRAATDAAFAAAGLVARIVVDGPEMDTVLRLVEHGVGVAIVPAMVAHGRPGLRTVPLATRLTRTVSLAHRADMAPTKAAAALRATILVVADSFASAAHFVARTG